MSGLFHTGMTGTNSEGLATRLKECAEAAERSFQAFSEEDQMLYLLSQEISFVAGQSGHCRDYVARRLMAKSHGPKFAERILNDPELRKKIGLDRHS